ncbi:MAG: STAS domain-containing protein, partial [Aquihabitans sp.]
TRAGELASERTGPELIVSIVGDLDAANAPEFSRRISEQTQPDDEVVWLDMSGVTFCASPGISLIVRAHNEALDRGGRAVVLRPSPALLRVLELCNLTNGLHIRTV